MAELNYLEIGANIRCQRQKKGIKQKELADEVNVSPQHISHIETGRSQPSLSTLVEIANVLGTDLNTLLGNNLTLSREYVLNSQVAQILSNIPDELFARILQFCKEEVQFYNSIK